MKSWMMLGMLSATLLTLSGCETDPVPTAGSAAIEQPLKANPVPPATFQSAGK